MGWRTVGSRRWLDACGTCVTHKPIAPLWLGAMLEKVSCLLHVGLAMLQSMLEFMGASVCELYCIIYSACSGVHSLAKAARPVDNDTFYFWCLVTQLWYWFLVAKGGKSR